MPSIGGMAATRLASFNEGPSNGGVFSLPNGDLFVILWSTKDDIENG